MKENALLMRSEGGLRRLLRLMESVCADQDPLCCMARWLLNNATSMPTGKAAQCDINAAKAPARRIPATFADFRMNAKWQSNFRLTLIIAS